jgi:hypothetical protein
MSGITCRAGETQIAKALARVHSEHADQKVHAAILIADACEESPEKLYDAARELGVPIFAFQDGNDDQVAEVYRQLARITKGAHCQFDGNSARQLAELLRAVAAFATGGIQALEQQSTGAARLLLTEMERKNDDKNHFR